MMRDDKLPYNLNEKISVLEKNLKNIDMISALFFFGSFVRQEIQPLSDIDIAVLLMNGPNRKEMFDIQLKLTGGITDILSTEKFDLVILNTAPLRLAYNILKNGKLVFVRNESPLIDFREKIVKQYLDFKYYQKEFNDTFLKGISYHG